MGLISRVSSRTYRDVMSSEELGEDVGSEYEEEEFGEVINTGSSSKHKVRSGKKNKSAKARLSKLDVLQDRVAELTKLLKNMDVYVGDMSDTDDMMLEGQRKGNGTGNTKDHRKVMKRKHTEMLQLWVVHLEKLVAVNS